MFPVFHLEDKVALWGWVLLSRHSNISRLKRARREILIRKVSFTPCSRVLAKKKRRGKKIRWEKKRKKGVTQVGEKRKENKHFLSFSPNPSESEGKICFQFFSLKKLRNTNFFSFLFNSIHFPSLVAVSWSGYRVLVVVGNKVCYHFRLQELLSLFKLLVEITEKFHSEFIPIFNLFSCWYELYSLISVHVVE